MQPFSIRRAFAIPASVALIATGAFLVAGCDSGSGDDNASPVSTQPSVGGAAGMTVAADQAGHPWASATSAAIKPGVQTYTQGSGQCTANYVFVDDSGNVYLGQAAHCASTRESNETNGCSAASLPLGTPVTINRAGTPMSKGEVIATGELVYSSWLTMRAEGEKDRNTCAYNDFALVKLAPGDVAEVNPSLPYWGGPVDINTTGANTGDRVYSYGNSSLRGGLAGLSPQTGISRAADPADGGWSHALNSPTPGIPGDSGSAFLDRAGRALGTLSTLGFALPIVNNIGDINHELTYARTHSGIAGLVLVLGTEPFDPNR
ncbi:hypothetical protein ACQPZ2_28210 [Nocardia pseudovaccinii]|uniref:hypothetical protein n=1 Tax=Nocardia pseudovaccinii TaxID=189540 RepID=UPI003D90A722